MLEAKILGCSIELLPDDFPATLRFVDAELRLDDLCFPFYQEREVDDLNRKFIIAHLGTDESYDFAIVPRLLEGDELNEERYCCSREGRRYIRIGLIDAYIGEESIVWPEDYQEIIHV